MYHTSDKDGTCAADACRDERLYLNTVSANDICRVVMTMHTSVA